MPQTAIEVFDDSGVALHGPHPCLKRRDVASRILELL
jgi:hypothetical protein